MAQARRVSSPAQNGMIATLKRLARNKTLSNLVKVLISVGLLVWLVRSGRLDLRLLFSVPITIWYLLGLGFLLLSMILQATRWWWLLKTQGIHISLWGAIKLSWIGQFFSVLLPGATGGELVRAYYIAQDNPNATIASVSTVMMDKFVGLYGLLLLGLPSVAILISGGNASANVLRSGAIIVALLSIMTIAAISLWWRPTREVALRLAPVRFRPPVRGMLEAYESQTRVVLSALLLSLVANTLFLLSYTMASRALQTNLSWQVIFLIVPLITIANSLPISPGGIGVAETVASVLFAQFGVPFGATVMLLMRLWIMLLRLPGALFFVMRKRDTESSQASASQSLAALDTAAEAENPPTLAPS